MASDKASKPNAIPRRKSRRVSWGTLSLAVVAVLLYCIPQFPITRTALNSIVTDRVNHRGAALATKLGDTSAAQFYSAQAIQIEVELQSFVSRPNGVVLAYKEPKQFNRTGLDAAVPLGVLVSGAQGASAWGPASDHILATLKAYVDSFRNEYKINKGEKKRAVATGRYAEDVYDGIGVSIGNPWYLTTLSVSHVIARALQYYTSTQSPIWINHINQPFWAQFDEKIHLGEVLTPRDKRWRRLISELARWSEGFWQVVRKHQGVHGQLDEQINRDTGLPQ
ncbi:hypothetical protein FRC00_009275 [Tulasnella sp. 408]|nr:hypothetical protein FRC00_009275 [Tulasnella sp. 408]